MTRNNLHFSPFPEGISFPLVRPNPHLKSRTAGFAPPTETLMRRTALDAYIARKSEIDTMLAHRTVR